MLSTEIELTHLAQLNKLFINANIKTKKRSWTETITRARPKENEVQVQCDSQFRLAFKLPHRRYQLRSIGTKRLLKLSRAALNRTADKAKAVGDRSLTRSLSVHRITSWGKSRPTDSLKSTRFRFYCTKTGFRFLIGTFLTSIFQRNYSLLCNCFHHVFVSDVSTVDILSGSSLKVIHLWLLRENIYHFNYSAYLFYCLLWMIANIVWFLSRRAISRVTH